MRARGMTRVLLAAAGLAAGPAAGRAAAPSPAPRPSASERVQRAGVRTARVARARLAAALRARGHVAPDEDAISVVSARAPGLVRSVAVHAGQRVRKGELLGTFESAELVAAQRAYIDAVKWADSIVRAGGRGDAAAEAREKLLRLGVSPDDAAELARRWDPLAAVPVRAPEDAWIAAAPALAGTWAERGAELFRLADPARLSVVVALPQADARRVAVGQAARVTLEAFPGATLEGRVAFVSPAVDAATRTVRARIALRDPQARLRPGLFAEAALELGGSEALAVPEDAVVDTGTARYVFVAGAAGRLEPRAVRTGTRARGLVELLEGVREGEEVVTSARFLLDSESDVAAALEAFGAGQRPETELPERATRPGS